LNRRVTIAGLRTEAALSRDGEKAAKEELRLALAQLDTVKHSLHVRTEELQTANTQVRLVSSCGKAHITGERIKYVDINIYTHICMGENS
jgi:hypothetical protein